jgi:hypothetical protein
VHCGLSLRPNHCSVLVVRREHKGHDMRFMQIPRFSRAIKVADLGTLIKTRLTNEVVIWPKQAIPLVGYMAWPNNSLARNNWDEVAQKWFDQSDLSMPPKLKIIQQHWARVADIMHKHYDLTRGEHQLRRGGSSVGKAISLIDANAKAKGTGSAKLWEIWKAYKDVAHLVTAAMLVSGDAQARYRIAPYQLEPHQLLPFRIAMLMPDLVISVAMEFERYGLGYVAHGRTEPMFDSESLWRISPDINVTPLAPPARKLISQDLVVLNARRAGNRGKTKRRNTTPVSG